MKTCFICEECGEGCYERIEEENRGLHVKINMLTMVNKRLSKIITKEKRKVSLSIPDKAVEFNKVKLKKAELKKNGCCLCGYKLCNTALEFHHIETKQREISSIRDINVLKAEFNNNKIVLLCANCHRLVHAGVINPDLIDKVLTIC